VSHTQSRFEDIFRIWGDIDQAWSAVTGLSKVDRWSLINFLIHASHECVEFEWTREWQFSPSSKIRQRSLQQGETEDLFPRLFCSTRDLTFHSDVYRPTFSMDSGRDVFSIPAGRKMPGLKSMRKLADHYRSQPFSYLYIYSERCHFLMGMKKWMM
jgi:hypothetical protein